MFIENVNNWPKNNKKIETIPLITKIVFESKSEQFKNKLECENSSENNVEVTEHSWVFGGLAMILKKKKSEKVLKLFANSLLSKLKVLQWQVVKSIIFANRAIN